MTKGGRRVHAPGLTKREAPTQDASLAAVSCVSSLNNLCGVSLLPEGVRARLSRISSSQIRLFLRRSAWTKRQAGMNRYVSTAPASARMGWFHHSPKPSITTQYGKHRDDV